MTRLLTRLTLALVGVIVAVLATFLILIATALIRANTNLEKLVGGLTAIRDQTAPLKADLATINGAAVTLGAGLGQLDGHLQNIARHLTAPAPAATPTE